MIVEASSSTGRPCDGLRERRGVSMQIITSITHSAICHDQAAGLTIIVRTSEIKLLQIVPAGIAEIIQKFPSLNLSAPRDNTEDNNSQTLGESSSDSPVHWRLLKAPQRYAAYTPFPSPTGSSSDLSVPSVINGPPDFRQASSPISTSSPHSRRASPVQEYHFETARYHKESAAYHDTVEDYYQTAAEYHNRALLYHDTQAGIHRVRFLSPITTFFPSSLETLPDHLNSHVRQRSMAGSIQGSDLSEPERNLSSSSTLRPAGIISLVNHKHSAIPDSGYLASTAAQDNDHGEPATVKWIIRAKTPSFSSDSEQEAYNGPCVSMNANKGWEPDVKIFKKGKSESSRPRSSSSKSSTNKSFPDSNRSTFPPFLGHFPQLGLQVPSLGSGGAHSRTSSGISGLSRITKASDFTGDSETSGYPDQSELMTRMLTPEQQVCNAENHAEAMKEALIKAFKAREESEDRATAAEAQLKSSLGLHPDECTESVLMEKARVANEKLAISQALLQKSRERNGQYENRMLRAEALVQRLADKVNSGIPTVLHSTKKDVAEAQKRFEHAIWRTEKAEQLLEDATGSDEALIKSYEERVKIAEDRAKRAEELQEKDRIWTVNADERAVNAESCVNELRAELARSQDLINDLEIQLIRIRSYADVVEKDFKDMENEIKTFESRANESEKEVYELKTKFLNLKKYTDELQKHHNAREEEFTACNNNWQDRENGFTKQCMDLRVWSDERVAECKEEIKKLDKRGEDLIRDGVLITEALTAAFKKVREPGKLITQEDVDELIACAAELPGLKESKYVGDSVAVIREKARRTLEGQAFTSSLGPGAFESSPHSSHSKYESAKPVEVDKESNVSKETQTSPIDTDARYLSGPSRFQPGVARLPVCSKGAWYAKMKNAKD